MEGLNQEKNDLMAALAAINKTTAVIEFTPDGTIIKANQNFLDTVGYLLTDIEKKHHRILCTTEYANSSEYKNFWQTLNLGEAVSGQFERVAKGGRIIWLEASYNPVFDQHNKLMKIIKFASDISETTIQSQVQQSMLTAIERSMAVIEFDTQGKIITANDNFLQATQYSLSEIKNQHHQIFCEKSLVNSPEYSIFWNDLNKGTFKSGQFKRLDSSGNVIWLEASYNPIFNARGDLLKVVKFATNITERVNRQQKLMMW